MSDKKNVLFAGYKRPHPLENCVQIKVQTIDERHPVDVLRVAVNNLMEVNAKLRRGFEEHMKKRVH